jgi:hypothetical protein
LQGIYQRILQSHLHKDIFELVRSPTDRQVFPDWHMGYAEVPASLIAQLSQARWEADAGNLGRLAMNSLGVKLLRDFWQRMPQEAAR